MKEPKTICTIETQYGKSTIEVNKTDLTIDEMFEQLIEPILLATGYSQEIIDGYLDNQ